MIDRKPFDGAITRYFEDDAPEAIRAALKTAEISDILDPTYPYAARMENSLYMAEMTALQIELAKFHAWVRETGQRIAVIFEGRDAAGKGGAIVRVMENLNPRVAQIVALKPRRGNGIFSATSSICQAAGKFGSLIAHGIIGALWNMCLGFARPRNARPFLPKPHGSRICCLRMGSA